MNRMLQFILCVALLAVASPLAARTADGPPEASRFRITEIFPPGGDVLRPGTRSDGYTWYFGFDVGPTFSSFSGGPLNFYTPITGPEEVSGTMESTVDGGSGVGFYVGLTADFPISDMVGIQVKGNFHNRAGSFENTQLIENIYVAELDEHRDVSFRDEVDWSFRYFGIDILGRFQLVEDSWYILAGPSIGVLLGNTADASQWISSPDDVFYREIDGATTNQIRSVYGEEDIEGFESLRLDLKFGVGTWIELMDGLFLTPELTMAYPLTGMVTESFATNRPTNVVDNGSQVHSRAIAYSDVDFLTGQQTATAFQDSNTDFNMITIFFTVGLRWQID